MKVLEQPKKRTYNEKDLIFGRKPLLTKTAIIFTTQEQIETQTNHMLQYLCLPERWVRSKKTGLVLSCLTHLDVKEGILNFIVLFIFLSETQMSFGYNNNKGN